MNRKWWQALIGLLWLALPAIGLRYWLLWDRLPARLATHFDAAGHPNGWMSREGSCVFTLVLMLFILTSATVTLSRVRKPDGPSWALLGMFYVIIEMLYHVEDAVLDYNLSGRSVEVLPVIIAVFVAVFVLVGIFLGTKRGVSLSSSAVLAEEVHASRLWGLVFVVPLTIELAVLVAVPHAAIRIAVGLGALLLFLAAALAWSGFHYFFTSSSVEIRTLGFRLRSIPTEQIKEYAVDRWNPIGGYGIRGIGDRRAYVWGNRGVRIKTTDGEVFLGHSEPERIVHDLDVIKQFAH
jgi:hypothetical protein